MTRQGLTSIPSKLHGFRSGKRLGGDSLLFIILLVLIALAGFNSGNNLLYLIVGVMLGLALISIVAARINISRLNVVRQLPTHAFADRTFITAIEITNKKKLIKSFGIVLHCGMNPRESLFVLSIENKGKSTYETEVKIPHRGLHRFPAIVIRSGFPLGLFSVRRKMKGADEIIVFPRIRSVEKLPEGSSHVREEFPQYLKGPGSSFYGAREYRHGEEAAYISWKLSAKLDKLIIRETEHEEKRRVCIVLDNALKSESAEHLEAFEHAVSNAASIAWHLCRSGYSVKLVTHTKVVGYGEGLDHMYRILTVLALVEPIFKSDAFPLVRHSVLEGGRGLLITCGKEAALPPAATSNFTLIMNERIGAEN